MIEERKKVDLRSAVDDFERRIIIDSLKENQGNVSAAAECLGIHRNVLYRKIEKLDIKKDSVKFTE